MVTGTGQTVGLEHLPLKSVKISVSFGFHPPRICYEMLFAWKLRCDTFTSLCKILSKTSFADLDVSFSKQLRELRADNPPKMRALPWQCSRHQNVLGPATAPVRADVVSCRRVSLVISGLSASGLYAPIAPSHALISMAAADTFLRLTSPSPQGVNKECSEML